VNSSTSALVACLLAAFAGSSSAACSVSLSSANFGTYDVFDPLPRDTTATLNIFCTTTTRNVLISAGPSSGSGTVAPRNMRGIGGERLAYNLYVDASRTQVFGNGTSGALPVVIDRITRRSPQQRVIYGRIPAGQDVARGNYGDTVTITVAP
jgi:spore coat protein U-like protein